MVELLLKHGARVDVEARMCWPGAHLQNCEERKNQDRQERSNRSGGAYFYSQKDPRDRTNQRSFDKLQCAIYYAIDGDQVSLHCLLLFAFGNVDFLSLSTSIEESKMFQTTTYEQFFKKYDMKYFTRWIYWSC